MFKLTRAMSLVAGITLAMTLTESYLDEMVDFEQSDLTKGPIYYGAFDAPIYVPTDKVPETCYAVNRFMIHTGQRPVKCYNLDTPTLLEIDAILDHPYQASTCRKRIERHPVYRHGAIGRDGDWFAHFFSKQCPQLKKSVETIVALQGVRVVGSPQFVINALM